VQALAGLLQRVGIGHQPARALQDLVAERRERDAPAQAVEQAPAEFVLQALDAARERGLGEVQGLGRLHEGPEFGQHHKVPQLHQRHPKISIQMHESLMINALDFKSDPS